MGDGQNSPMIDLIRWTFTVDAERAAEVVEHLTDLGLDVMLREGTDVLALWDEPEGNIDEVVEALWAINGEPFEITQEEFHRESLVHVHHEEDGAEPGRAVA